MALKLALAALLIAGSATACPPAQAPKERAPQEQTCKPYSVIRAEDHGYEEGRESRIDVYFYTANCHVSFATISNRAWLDSTCSTDYGGKTRYWDKCLSEDPVKEYNNGATG